MAITIDTLAYSRRLREAGFTEQQANAQAEALAAAMTDTLATKPDLHELNVRMQAGFAATKQDLRELEVRVDAQIAAFRSDVNARFAQVDARFEYLERHMDTRFAEHTARFKGDLADLERRITTRLGAMMVGAIGVVSALVKIL